MHRYLSLADAHSVQHIFTVAGGHTATIDSAYDAAITSSRGTEGLMRTRIRASTIALASVAALLIGASPVGAAVIEGTDMADPGD
jgi:hypothetical protein